MKKILIIFIGVLFFSMSGFAREKAPINPRQRADTKTIIVEKIVEVPAGSSTVINNTVNINIGMCADTYKQQTITYCAGVNGCKDMSNIEVLMAIDPMIPADCRGLAQNSKLSAISAGMAVHLRCLNAHGLYDLNNGLCKFIVELRRGKKVKATTNVWEGKEYSCGKELFPMAQKNRNKAIIGGGLIGGTAGAIGGGLINQKIFGFNKNLHAVLEASPCSIASKEDRKAVIEKMKNNEYKTWSEFVTGLETEGNLSPTNAKLCAQFFVDQNYVEGVLKALEKHFTKTDVNTFEILDAEVYFEFDSDKIKVSRPNADDELNKFGDAFTDDLKSCMDLNLIGLSSNVGDEDYNENLAQRRADAVKAKLVSLGFSGTITIDPKGDEGNTGNKDESRNRRVDIKIDLDRCNGPAVVSEDESIVDGSGFTVDKNKFYKKSDFIKGAVIGGTGLGLVGAGIGALFTKYKCWLSNTDTMLAKWKKTFKITP
ncbi:MAG: OmpA family protein [Alphaproteobacteria bacterium]